jgi:hypothetical protein
MEITFAFLAPLREAFNRELREFIFLKMCRFEGLRCCSDRLNVLL